MALTPGNIPAVGDGIGTTFIPPGTTGTVLASNGPSAMPSFQGSIVGPTGPAGAPTGPTGVTGYTGAQIIH